jgi:HK97 family phage prohead protease
MPYFITDQADGCSGWATVKDDGEVMGCHDTKQAAIDQAVAIALAEDSEFVGERSDEARQVDTSPPDYVREAAAQGLEFHADGLSGDGVVERTIREARLMADGQVSEDKAIRVAAWAARHEVDLEADGARPDEDGYPTAGAVAHLLWGIPTGAQYQDARAFWDNLAERIREQERYMITPVEARTEGSDVEFRMFSGELRAEGDGDTFVGYAAVFNSDSEPLPFTERIMPGAFGKSLRSRKRDIRAYINHDSNMVLASTRSGTLRLSEDDRGLRAEFELPEGVTYANDLRSLMRSGIVDKMSFGFTVPRGGDRWSEDGRTRELREVVLHEVSVVTGFPAYEGTTAAVRSLETLCERTGMSVDEIAHVLQRLADRPQETVEASAANLLELKRRQAELAAKKVV